MPCADLHSILHNPGDVRHIVIRLQRLHNALQRLHIAVQPAAKRLQLLNPLLVLPQLLPYLLIIKPAATAHRKQHGYVCKNLFHLNVCYFLF